MEVIFLVYLHLYSCRRYFSLTITQPVALSSNLQVVVTILGSPSTKEARMSF
jgi:hypothetical protein